MCCMLLVLVLRLEQYNDDDNNNIDKNNIVCVCLSLGKALMTSSQLTTAMKPHLSAP